MTHDTATQDLINRFNQEQAARSARINAGIHAIETVLSELADTEEMPEATFLTRMHAVNGTDRATAREILTAYNIANRIKEIVQRVTPTDAIEVTIRRLNLFEQAQASRYIANVPHNPAPQYDLFTPVSAFIAKHPCACCGNYTMAHPPSGSYDICPVCYWEDDRYQDDDPNFRGGANAPSLNMARLAYKRYGACEQRLIPSVRAPKPAEKPEYRYILGLLV